jgi:hypothetical protein
MYTLLWLGFGSHRRRALNKSPRSTAARQVLSSRFFDKSIVVEWFAKEGVRSECQPNREMQLP